MPNDYTGLLTGSHWNGIEVYDSPVIVTYSFPVTVPGYVPGITDPGLTAAALASWQGFSAAEADIARAALAEWGDASGLVFIEVGNGQGDINFQKLDLSGTWYDGAGGIGYRPFGDWSFASLPAFTSDFDGSGDVFMNTDIAVTYGTLLHEIGHALGLKHPTEVWTQYAGTAPVEHAVWDVNDPNLTIMAEGPGVLGSLGAIDIQAIQAIYGTQGQDGTQVASWSFDAGKQRLTLAGYETADVMRGSSVRDAMAGNGGDDRLYGLYGKDTLTGGDGSDTLDGGAGADKLTGGAGDDTYYVQDKDKVTEGADGGRDTVIAMGDHTLAAEVEVLQNWGTGKATLRGNGTANEIYAGAGATQMQGLAGQDYLVGGAGKDKIEGGADGDVMFGQGGADTFVFAALTDFAADVIGDFAQAQGDRIDLRGVDPNPGAAGDQAFSFIGTDAFGGGVQYQLRYRFDGGNTVIEIDANRDAVVDHTILLYGEVALEAGDFRL